MATLNPNLLRQYDEADFNFVLLHSPAFVGKRGRKLGKAARSMNWPSASVSYSEALSHMNGGGNVGVQMGTAGYLVVDYDPRADEKAGTPANGLNKLMSYLEIDITKTARVITGRTGDKAQGQHIYFKVSPEWRGRTKLPKESHPFPGVELKHSAGQYVVAAGSVHPGEDGSDEMGDRYRWHKDSAPLIQAMEAPPKLLEAFARPEPEHNLRGDGENGWGSYEPDEIAKGLEFLNPEDFRDHDTEWLPLMMAVHWASGGTAREAFVSWSTSDPLYGDHGETIEYRWDTLSHRPDREGGMIRGGYFFKQLNERGCPPENYPKRRVEAMFDDLTEDDLLADMSAKLMTSTSTVIEYMNARHAIVLDGRKSQYIRPSVYELSDYHDPELIEVFCERRALDEYYSNKFVEVPVAGKLKRMTWFEHWMAHEHRRQYIGIEFRPGVEASERYIEGQGIIYNSFRGWKYDKHERGPGDWKLFKQMIREVIAGGDPEHFEYILNYMAYSLQHADRPQEVMMVVRGEKGVGKSIWAERWLKMFGSHGMATTRMDSLIGQFNSRVSRLCAVYIDEGMWGGDKAAEQHLKRLITEETLDTEAKFESRKTVRNYLTVVMTTNNAWAIPASIEERRFAVFDAKTVWPQNDPFFGQVKQEMDLAGGMQAMFYDLMHRDIRGYHPRHIPVTQALRDQKMLSMGGEAQWWVDFLEQGGTPEMFVEANEGAPPNWEETGVYIPTEVLHRSLKHSDVKLGSNFEHRFAQAFGIAMKSIAPKNTEMSIKRSVPKRLEFDFANLKKMGDGRVKCFWFPPLPECRKWMTENFGIDFEFKDAAKGDVSKIKDTLDELA